MAYLQIALTSPKSRSPDSRLFAIKYLAERRLRGRHVRTVALQPMLASLSVD